MLRRLWRRLFQRQPGLREGPVDETLVAAAVPFLNKVLERATIDLRSTGEPAQVRDAVFARAPLACLVAFVSICCAALATADDPVLRSTLYRIFIGIGEGPLAPFMNCPTERGSLESGAAAMTGRAMEAYESAGLAPAGSLPGLAVPAGRALAGSFLARRGDGAAPRPRAGDVMLMLDLIDGSERSRQDLMARLGRPANGRDDEAAA